MMATKLKAPDHQVAGHKASDGRLGPLVDDSGCFYKPLQNDDRGLKEVAFYEKFSSMTGIPTHIRRFFPTFHGVKSLEASDGSGMQPHLAMEDLVFGVKRPCLMDIKIGSRTWYPEAPEKYIHKCLAKDRESTTISLGFRISGFQVHGSEELSFWKPDKKLVKSLLTPDDVRLVLRRFVSADVSPGIDSVVVPDCSQASRVYGGSSGILAQLVELKEWFEDQTIFHFNSCSVLILYDKELASNGKSRGPEVKLVDFAHVLEGNGVIDHNFLGGLYSFIKFISDIVKETELSSKN